MRARSPNCSCYNCTLDHPQPATSVSDQLGITPDLSKPEPEPMSNTGGTPFDDGPNPGRSIRDPFAEFLSESELEFQTAPPAGTSDELELFASEEVAVQTFGAGRARSLGWSLVTGAAVAAIMAASLTGLMMRGRGWPSGERLVQHAVSETVGPLPSAPVVPHGAAAAVPVMNQLPSPTISRVRGGKRSNTDSRAVALARVTATAGARAISAHRPSSGNDMQALPVVAPARASLLLASVPASPPANPAIPTSSAPADVRVTAMASDADGDELTYRWSAPIGRFANAMERETVYTCPDTATTVALTVTVTDGRGGIASDTLAIHCVERR